MEKNKQLLKLKSKQYENIIDKAEDHITIGSLLLRNNVVLKEIDRIDKAKESVLSL